MNLEDLLFPVKMVPSKTLLPDFVFVNKHEVAIIVEPENLPLGKIVNFPSAGYGLLPLADIIVPLEEQLREKYSIVGTYSHRDHAKFSITYVIENKEVTVGKKDKLNPFIKIIHSYDSSTLFTVRFGFWRKVSNTAIMGAQFPMDIVFSHTADMVEEIMESTLASVEDFVENCEEYKVSAYDLINKKISDPESLIDKIMEGTNELKGYKDQILERVNLEVAGKLPLTAWLIYNAFNYQLNYLSEAQENIKMKKDQRIYLFIASAYEVQS